jgi:hypothetical protein
MFKNVHIHWGKNIILKLCDTSEKEDSYLTGHPLLLIVTCKVYFAVFLAFCLSEFDYVFIFM